MSDAPGMRALFAEWLDQHDNEQDPAIAAATVVVLRDTDAGPETLMMRRNSKVNFGGMWVFPGGRIDAGDYPDGASDDIFAASRTAAVREASEEGDLDISADAMIRYSHWMPPKQAPKRFSTWFFLARAPEGPVTIDDGEILEAQWWRPAECLERHKNAEIEMAPPTWVTLAELAEFDSVADALANAAARETPFYVTRIARSDHMVALWTGDAGYESGDLDREGGRHRLTMDPAGWRFELS